MAFPLSLRRRTRSSCMVWCGLARVQGTLKKASRLIDYGAVTRVPRVGALRVPLAGYADAAAFKLFCVDIGLLGALARLPVEAVLKGTSLFTEFKGSLAEQYVCQQLVAQGYEPHYWSSGTGRAELDFAIERGGLPLGIEVKAHENLQVKSLKDARDKFSLGLCVRTSLAGYRHEGWLVNIPLWAMAALNRSLG